MYTLSFAPTLLIIGFITEKVNKVRMVGVTCLIWGLLTYFNAYMTEMYQLYYLRVALGFV